MIALLLFFSLHIAAQDVKNKYSFTISGSQTWTDTGVDLSAGDLLTFTAKSKSASDSGCSPAGASATNSGSAKLPMPSSPVGAVIAKASDDAVPTAISSSGGLFA